MNSITMDRIVQQLRRPRVRTRISTAIGVAAIIASACSVQAVSDSDVLTSIIVAPNATLAARSSRQMRAIGLDAHGQFVNIAPRWSVVGSGTITADGVFTAGALSGTFGDTVIASTRGLSGRAAITVTP